MEKPILIKDLGWLYYTEISKNKTHFGLFKCECGNEFKSNMYHVESGHTRSCGCLQPKVAIANCYKHGMADTDIYIKWKSIKNRCYTKSNISYPIYGGKGITVCNEWLNDFMSFYNWCINNGYKKELNIDREDPSGNYTPYNCRFIDDVKSAQNVGIRKDNKSGYKGVSWKKSMAKWEVRIYNNKEETTIGYFDTAKEGGIAYNNWVIEHKTFHRLNYIPED